MKDSAQLEVQIFVTPHIVRPQKSNALIVPAILAQSERFRYVMTVPEVPNGLAHQRLSVIHAFCRRNKRNRSRWPAQQLVGKTVSDSILMFIVKFHQVYILPLAMLGHLKKVGNTIEPGITRQRWRNIVKLNLMHSIDYNRP